MRGGYARRSRRESCHAQSAFPARFSEQNNFTRASYRALQDATNSGLTGGEDRVPRPEVPLPPPPLLPLAAEAEAAAVLGNEADEVEASLDWSCRIWRLADSL
jgi:hypothetical protein